MRGYGLQERMGLLSNAVAVMAASLDYLAVGSDTAAEHLVHF